MAEEKKSPVGGKGIGGQAVIEGVMMRGKRMYALAVRNSKSKEIEVFEQEVVPASDKLVFLGWPIVRGVVSFVDSLIMGMKVITKSAEMSGLEDFEDEEENKSGFDKWLEEKFGDKLADYIIYFSVFIAIIMSVAIFMVLPVWLSSLINRFFLNVDTWALGIVEGLVRIFIFLGYILLTAQLKDVKRVFMYHGAEHKTINCFESDEELTVENVKKHTRLHKRCGTSFLIFVMIISMIVFLFLRTDVVWLRIVSRVLFVPVIAGLSYEVIKWAGRNDNKLVKVVSAPGLALQLVTTKEPDDEMIEVAIKSLKTVLEKEPEEKSK